MSAAGKPDTTKRPLREQQIISAAKVAHDAVCGCDPKYLMSCPRMASAILGVPREDSKATLTPACIWCDTTERVRIPFQPWCDCCTFYACEDRAACDSADQQSKENK